MSPLPNITPSIIAHTKKKISTNNIKHVDAKVKMTVTSFLIKFLGHSMVAGMKKVIIFINIDTITEKPFTSK